MLMEGKKTGGFFVVKLFKNPLPVSSNWKGRNSLLEPELIS